MESTVKHSVKAYLHDNPLTDNPNDMLARVSCENTLGVEEICKVAVSRGGAATSPEIMQHHVNLFFKEMAYQLCDGYAINTGYFTAAALIKGIFNTPKENFNPDKHSLLFQFNQGDNLRKSLSNIKVEIMGVAETGCEILQVNDVKTGSVNDLITPNRNLRIKGSKIKLAGQGDNVGVFFIHQGSGETTRVDPSDIVTNNPSEVIIIVPELASGVYIIEIRTQYAGSTLLKTPRVGTFDKLLTVP